MAGLLDHLLANGVTLADLGSVRVGRGETLIRQGAPSEAIYFVMAGRFRVERDGHLIGHIDTGSVVGDIGFFTGAERSATVIAFRDSLVLRLTRDNYESHCARHPALREAIIAELASRFNERFHTPDIATLDRTRPRTLAVLSAGGGCLPPAFIDRLMAALSGICTAQAVTFASFDANSEHSTPDSIEGVDCFSRTERRADITLYLPEPGNPDWQQAIVRQSDQVLFVGSAGTPPELSPDETFAMSQIPVQQRRLVLIHRRRRPTVTGTEDWLSRRPVAMHHHVAMGGDADIQRLARFLTGTATGLILSGGGAYGMAHIGVGRALAGAGMTFDIYGGTSVGSAMSAAFALGVPETELVERIRDIFVRSRSLRRLTLPRYALLDHKMFDAKLLEHFTDLDIANMWMPYYAVAANLNTKSIEVVRRGPLWEAIRASSALPGILPPFIRNDGCLLVDGGILDNLPYRAVRHIKAGPNVVVSLAREHLSSPGYAYERLPGRAGLVMGTLGRRAWRNPPAPGVFETIIRSMTVGSLRSVDDLGPEDWLVAPPLSPEMGFMNWKGAFSLVETAAAHTRDKLAQLETRDPELWGAFARSGKTGRRR